MKYSLKLEELASFILSIYLFNQLNYAWWWFLALILLPDIGMFGYALSNKFGAITYNIFHHKGIAIFLVLIGWQLNQEQITLTGIILFGHSSLDRIMGYGLKYQDSFKDTHLGKLN